MAFALAVLGMAACGDDGSADTQPIDAGTDGTADVGTDGPADVGFDINLPDSGMDVGSDTATDTGADAGMDATPDADAVGDVATDTGPASCEDRVLNRDETDIDCGGTMCPACVDGSDCAASSDCESRACIIRICRAVSCTDGIQNGDESSADCGGTGCDPCGVGDACGVPSDCESAICSAGVCSDADCGDDVLNGDETDIDCGGADCASCMVGDDCSVGTDCDTGSCDVTCRAPTCTDGVMNGTETDVDCGGPGLCPRCPDFSRCVAPSDCTTAMCTMNFCGDDPCIPFGTDTHGNTGCSFTPVASACPDIAVTGTPTGLGDDVELLLPIGFNFEFYGSNYTNVTVSANGSLVFDSCAGACDLSLSNDCLPTTDVMHGIFAFWDDLDPGEPGAEVYFQAIGAAPNRTFVVQWKTPHIGFGSEMVDFTVVLHETSNEVSVCYTDVDTAIMTSTAGASATVGIQSGTDSLEFSCNMPDLTDGLLIRYLAP